MASILNEADAETGGVVPILFGLFFSVPSLHALVFIQKIFCDL